MNETVFIFGSDGYIGNALLQRLLFKKYTVIGIDNFLKRSNMKILKTKSAIKFDEPVERIEKLKKLGDYTFFHMDIAKDSDKLDELIKKYKPSTIFNLAHISSAPWSMQDRDYASYTLMNNILGTNNILWSIKNNCPDCHYITIGSTGEYNHYSNVPIKEGYFYINENNRKSKEMIYPRSAGSIYHSSKIANTYLIEFLTRSWNLSTTDIMQSIVFGSYTDEIDETKIYSSFCIDEALGTVLNIFVAQAKNNIPLSIYGKGEHQRGFLSLNDSIQALMIALKNKPKKDRTQVWNQLSEWHSMNDIAKKVQIVGKKLKCNVKLQNIKSPRTEQTTKHFYEYETKILKDFGYKPTRTIEQEIEYCFNLIDDCTFSEPKINWK